MATNERTVLFFPPKLKHRLEIASAVERRTASAIASEAIAAYLDSKEAESLDPASIADDDSTKSVELAAAC